VGHLWLNGWGIHDLMCGHLWWGSYDRVSWCSGGEFCHSFSSGGKCVHCFQFSQLAPA